VRSLAGAIGVTVGDEQALETWLQEALFEAQSQRGAPRMDALRRADAALNHLRLYLRLAWDWRWLNAGQYEHVSAIIAEIGRLLGGWLKQSAR
jgi:hypothetical protein